MVLRRRRRRRVEPRTVAAGLAALAAAAAAGVVARRRRAAGRAEQSWRCDCGQRYVVRGLDRHRMYWLADAAEADPLLGRECVKCGEPLPATHDAALSARSPAAS